MNRIILIGNGFDLAHGLKTSYRDFIDDLWEQKNCVSIKVFYHQIDEQTNNFGEVIRSISRNFDDKALMRAKVVNKNYSETL